jgi:anti-sigma factor RsiW
MSFEPRPDSTCPHADDTGAYVLRALADTELRAFAAHLESCASCRQEVEELQAVADQLPMAAPQLVPPPDLRNRIMSVVESEAQLLRAAGPEADRVPATPRRPPRERFRWTRIFVSPGIAASLAAVFVFLGVGAGVLLSGDDGPGPVRTVAASTAPEGSTAAVEVQDDVATLVVSDLPAPKSGRVYQVWVRSGAAPTPTHTLFNVRTDGDARVKVDESMAGVEEILVTEEPSGGSNIPSGPPVIAATVN